MTKQTKSKGWPKIGTVRKSETGSYIKFEDGYKIIDPEGNEVPMNDSRTANLEDPIEKVRSMIQRGVITGDQADARLEKAQEISSWLRFDIVIPPPKPK